MKKLKSHNLIESILQWLTFTSTNYVAQIMLRTPERPNDGSALHRRCAVEIIKHTLTCFKRDVRPSAEKM